MLETILDAPCVFCGYQKLGYWQAQTHAPECPWHAVGGKWSRIEALRRTLGALFTLARPSLVHSTPALPVSLVADEPPPAAVPTRNRVGRPRKGSES